MTGSTSEAIAKRAAACKHWRWMPGMLARYDQLSDAWPRWPERLRDVPKYLALDPQAAWPDLTDPATLGCLLALVRDAHRDAYMVAYHDGEGWIVADCDGAEVCRGTSERGVLVSALEAAE